MKVLIKTNPKWAQPPLNSKPVTFIAIWIFANLAHTIRDIMEKMKKSEKNLFLFTIFLFGIFSDFCPEKSPKTQKIKNLKNKFCSQSYKLGFGQFLWKMGKLVKRNKFFSDFFIFSIISLIAGVKFANIQIATKSQPCWVERWLSPFWNRHDEYFHMGENEENLRLFLRPPPTPLN